MMRTARQIVVGMIAVAFPLIRAEAQWPSSCKSIGYAEVIGVEPENWSEHREDWFAKLAPVLEGTSVEGRDPLADARQRIGAFWQEDSVSVEWALAELISNDFVTTRVQAERAAELYRALSGRAGPIVTTLRWSVDENRRYEGLAAIKALVGEREELQVLMFACDALWLRRALVSDSSYWKRPGGIPWALRNTEVLIVAYNLLNGEHRRGLFPSIIQALGPEFRSRLRV